MKIEGLKRYIYHKAIEAGRIDAITPPYMAIAGLDRNVEMSLSWFVKHEPEVGGYLVVYEDGYVSYSPRQGFLEGYALIREDAPEIYRRYMIEDVVKDQDHAWMFFVDRDVREQLASPEFIAEHNPQPGGYLVIYKDGTRGYHGDDI